MHAVSPKAATLREWWAVASSSSGAVLAAAGNGTSIYVSTDSGATWKPRGSVAYWTSLVSSSSGAKLVVKPNI